MAHKGNILITSLASLLRAIWKLLLLCCYAFAKLIQLLAELLAKITEKFI